MITEGMTLADLVIVASIAFFLGSVPTAWIVARARGVDIFRVGTRQAGAANVYREVGHTSAIIVGVVDALKGALAILIALWANLEGSWLLLPAVAAILGHWNSPFTRFRGGDGVATAVGVTFAMSPAGLFIPLFIGGFVTLVLSNFMEHPSPWGGLVGVAALLLLAPLSLVAIEPTMVVGLTLIAASIFLHSYTYHRRNVGEAGVKVQEEDLPDAQIPRTQER